MQFSGASQAMSYEFDVRFRCRDSTLGFLLKNMQDIDRFCQADGIDRSIGIASIIGNNLQYPATQTLQRLRVDVFVPCLRLIESEAEFILHCRRKAPKFIQRISQPYKWLGEGFLFRLFHKRDSVCQIWHTLKSPDQFRVCHTASQGRVRGCWTIRGSLVQISPNLIESVASQECRFDGHRPDTKVTQSGC